MGHGSLNPVGFRELAAWGLGRRSRRRVEGDSMRPWLAPGDQLLVRSLSGRPAAGACVVLRHPERPETRIVKRVSRVLPDGRLEVLGFNEASSTDSRQFGPVPVRQVEGEVTGVFR